MLPACFPDLDPASNLLLKTPFVGNDQNSVSGLGFGSWFRNSLTGCWMHFCGWARLAVGNRDGIGWQISQLPLLKQLGRLKKYKRDLETDVRGFLLGAL